MIQVNRFMAYTANRHYIKPMLLLVPSEMMVMNCRPLFTDGAKEISHFRKYAFFNRMTNCLPSLFHFYWLIILFIKQFAFFALLPFFTALFLDFWMKLLVCCRSLHNSWFIFSIGLALQYLSAILALRTISILHGAHFVKLTDWLDLLAYRASLIHLILQIKMPFATPARASQKADLIVSANRLLAQTI